jgi:hypothetical protein
VGATLSSVLCALRSVQLCAMSGYTHTVQEAWRRRSCGHAQLRTRGLHAGDRFPCPPTPLSVFARCSPFFSRQFPGPVCARVVSSHGPGQSHACLGLRRRVAVETGNEPETRLPLRVQAAVRSVRRGAVLWRGADRCASRRGSRADRPRRRAGRLRPAAPDVFFDLSTSREAPDPLYYHSRSRT